MRTSNTTTCKHNFEESTRFIDRIARRAVLAKLEKIQCGFIQIIDDGKVYQFGNQDSCSIKACITVRNASFYSSVAFAGSVGESVVEAHVSRRPACA